MCRRALLILLLVVPAQAGESARPLIVGHRGLLNHAPENTLAGFRAALELRLGFEFDVARTKDGHLICIHDKTVNRTTDGQGSVPDGLSLNPATGLITGTIAAGAAADGPFTVDVAVTNGTVSASQTFNWNINPVVNLTAPDDQSNNEGDNVSLQVTATDALGNALTYSDNDTLPPGLSIDSTTGLITARLRPAMRRMVPTS